MRIKKGSGGVSAVAVLLFVVLGFAGPAAAHDPIFLTDEQTAPDTGPFLPDGAISWAIYGSMGEADQTRGFEFDLRDGDQLFFSLLIPNLEPELLLTEAELPFVELTFPDGEVRTIEPIIGEVFDEEFSRTSYVTLYETTEPGQAGRHEVVVHSRAPSRFSVAVGEREEFGTPAERTVDRPNGFTEFAAPLSAWYSTAPGEEPAEVTEELEIDIEGAEAALEELAETEANGDSDDSDEAAAQDDAVVVEESGASLTLVMPLVAGIAAVGAGFVVMRRRRSAA